MHRHLLPVLLAVLALSACAPQGEARLVGSSRSSSRSSAVSSVRRSAAAVSSARRSSAAAPASDPVDLERLKTLKIPVLVYHHIRDTKGYPKTTWSWKMSVTESTFERQMQWIADHGYTTVDLNTLVGILKGEIAGPQKPLVITFDDNNLSQYTLGLPVLEKHSQIAVFYMITGRLYGAGLISTEQTIDLHKRGQDIESHTVTHRVLPALPADAIDAELRDSKKTLEDLLGKQILHVAYPGTEQNKTVRAAATAAGYVTGTIMDPRPATVNDDLLKIPRIMMTDDTNLAKMLP